MPMDVGGTMGRKLLYPGGKSELRLGQESDVVVSELMPRFYELARHKVVYGTASQAGIATSTALNTTHTGLTLSNTPGNTYNLVPIRLTFGWSVIAAAINIVGYSLGFSTTAVTHTAAITPFSTYYGVGPAPTGKVDSSATLPAAPVWAGFISDTPTATTNPAAANFFFDGELILPPGAYLSSETVTASSALGTWWSITWIELPIVPTT